jgi:hypothetical protein
MQAETCRWLRRIFLHHKVLILPDGFLADLPSLVDSFIVHHCRLTKITAQGFYGFPNTEEARGY